MSFVGPIVGVCQSVVVLAISCSSHAKGRIDAGTSSMNTRRSIFLRAGLLFLTLGLLPPMSSAVAASVTPKFRPHLGCYENNDADRRGFCLFDRGVLESYHMLTTEGFDDCGKYNVRARDRIMFWWPPGAWNSALISTDIVNKPIKGTCTWRADKDDNLILSNCEMKGEWKRLPDDPPHQPSAKDCAPPSLAETFVDAARAGDLATMQKLLARGVDVNAKGDKYGGTALMAASLNSQTDAVRALLRKGANVNAKDNFGRTALLSGASFGPLELVRALLEKGADVNVRSNDTTGTALAGASFGGHLDIVRALLDKGADVNTKGNMDGGTALMAASAQGHLDVVQALLENGADVNAKASDSTTALSVAKDDAVKAVLTEAGATP
jgi:ankyrin repeat protein